MNLPFVQRWSNIDDVCLVIFENVVSFELIYVRPSSYATFVPPLFQAFQLFLTEFRMIRLIFRFQNKDKRSQRSADMILI